MPDVMKTLLLNPPSFEKFDGGASSRWPVTREIESYWYPVWLTFATGMIPGARLLDASPAKVTKAQTVEIARDYEFLVLFTSTVGFESDLDLLRQIKEKNSSLKVAFVGPHVQNRPDESLKASENIDFIVRGEFDHAVVEFAQGKPLDQILGISYRKDGKILATGSRPQLHTEELDALPFAMDVYKQNLKIENYTVPFLLHPFASIYTTRGCPALCTFCQWPQTISGHAWRVRSTENVAREIKADPKIAGTRLILLAGLGQGISPEKLRSADITDCCFKPLRQSTLFDCLTNALLESSAGLQPGARSSAAPRPQLQKARVLIAEDNTVNRQVALVQLEQLGYRAEAVPNGLAVLEALNRTPYDIILMDCQMPEMDGYETTRRIRMRTENFRQPYIIAMTAHAMSGDTEKCLAAGMNDYISKPVQLDAFAAALARGLSKKVETTPLNRRHAG